MPTIHIDPAVLRAALHCTSSETTRYYLHGVCLSEVGGHTYATATDGHVLFTHLLPDVPKGTVPGERSYILHKDDIKRALGALPKKATSPLTVDLGKDTWTTVLPGGSLTANYIDAGYPSWARVLPKWPFSNPLTEGRTVTFAPECQMRLEKAFAVLAPRSTSRQIIPNGEAPAPFVDPQCPNAFGVIVPRIVQDNTSAVHAAREFLSLFKDS